MTRQCMMTALICALSLAAPAHAASITGRVLDEDGNALAIAALNADGTVVAVDQEGRFRFETEAPYVRIDVTASGHYRFVHTVESDIGQLPDITLVRQAPERRLLLFAGDAMLARRYFEPREGEPVLVRAGHVADDGAALLRAVAPYVELADFASVNLETQLADAQPAEPLPKSVTFYSPTELASLLRDAGFDYVALGNNHIFDYRDAGLHATLEAVTRAGLASSGAGAGDESARRPHVTALDGQLYSFASYVGWAGSFEPNQVAGPDKGGAALGSESVFAEDAGQFVGTSVLQLHAGLEYSEAPALSERTTLRSAVDRGVDLAIGHHPHVLQGLEVYRDRLIAYSMGNFLFDQYHYATQLGMLLYVWMDGDRLHRAEVVPLHVNGYVPTPATGNLRRAILGRLARLSAPFGTCLVETGAHAAIMPARAHENCRPQKVAISPNATSKPIALYDFLSPVRPVQVMPLARYRIGVDILHRGDFEYVGRFGTTDRSWIVDGSVSVSGVEPREMRINVLPGAGPVTAGMKDFERVFRPSNPATISGRLRVAGSASVRFLLQRRRPQEALSDALAAGPTVELGRIVASGDEWRDFAFSFDQPRIATQSLRLLIVVADNSETAAGAVVRLDDLAWIEWLSPWQQGDAGTEEIAAFASHIQLRSNPGPAAAPPIAPVE